MSQDSHEPRTPATREECEKLQAWVTATSVIPENTATRIGDLISEAIAGRTQITEAANKIADLETRLRAACEEVQEVRNDRARYENVTKLLDDAKVAKGYIDERIKALISARMTIATDRDNLNNLLRKSGEQASELCEKLSTAERKLAEFERRDRMGDDMIAKARACMLATEAEVTGLHERMGIQAREIGALVRERDAAIAERDLERKRVERVISEREEITRLRLLAHRLVTQYTSDTYEESYRKEIDGGEATGAVAAGEIKVFREMRDAHDAEQTARIAADAARDEARADRDALQAANEKNAAVIATAVIKLENAGVRGPITPLEWMTDGISGLVKQRNAARDRCELADQSLKIIRRDRDVAEALLEQERKSRTDHYSTRELAKVRELAIAFRPDGVDVPCLTTPTLEILEGSVKAMHAEILTRRYNMEQALKHSRSLADLNDVLRDDASAARKESARRLRLYLDIVDALSPVPLMPDEAIERARMLCSGDRDGIVSPPPAPEPDDKFRTRVLEAVRRNTLAKRADFDAAMIATGAALDEIAERFDVTPRRS